MKFKKFVKESLEDMDKRCEACNTLLNDMGKCPKCDEGEEDYGDELELDEKLTEATECTCGECEECLKKQKLEEAQELSNVEKLKRAFPELNFDEPETIEEDVKCEELSNLEKLKRAYPELDFGDTLTEAAGADTVHVVKDAMTVLANDDKNTWAKTVAEIVDVIPDDFADELFDQIKRKFTNIKLNIDQRKAVANASGNTDVEMENKDTVGEILDLLDPSDTIEQNPEFAKSLVMTILGIVAIIEPTPVLEVITAIVGLLPADIISKILNIVNMVSITPTTVNHAYNAVKSLTDKPDMDQVNEGIETCEDPVQEDIDFEASDYFDYDDDYDFDDVEEDRAHAALYGGDRSYCSCGRRLIRDEWGGYCPVCDAEEKEIDRVYHDADEEELRRMDAFDNMHDDEFEYDDNI